MRQLRRALAVALILTGLVAGIALAAHQINSTVVYDGGTTVATYQVVNDPSLNGISHVVIPACLPALVTVQGCPGEITTGYDPTTGVTGIKCDAGGSYELTLIYGDELETATDNAAIKYGSTFSLVPVTVATCIPQAVTIDLFEVRDGAFRWISGMPDGLDYRVRMATPVGSRAEVWMTDLVAGVNPGGWGDEYWAKPLRELTPGAIYELMAHDIYGEYGVAASLVYQPAMERGGSGPVVWKAFCPRWYELRQIPTTSGGVHVLCVRMAEEAAR